MPSVDENQLEAQVRALHEAGDLRGAATLMLQRLGADVLRVLHARFRNADLTAEVFARFAEALWQALPSFAFRCSVRAFMFTLARNAGNRFLARELKHQRLAVPLSELNPLAVQVTELRTQTKLHLLTESKDRVAKLRAELSEDDQLLLTLRIDRSLEFREIAVVMLDDTTASDEAISREAARLRKRLQLVKEQLKRLLRKAR
jgi:RNA polymerase sigma-70 factor, ECF subfamily